MIAKDSFGILAAILILPLIFLLISIIQNPVISIEANGIGVTRLFIPYKFDEQNIQSIDLFSKEDGLCTKIVFENGKELILKDIYYTNLHEIRQAIVNQFQHKVKPFKTEPPFQPIVNNEHGIKKSLDNPSLSVRGMMTYVLLFSSLVIFGIDSLPVQLSLAVIILTFVYIQWSLFNYFLLSNQELRVKNYYFPWVDEIFEIRKIIAIRFVHPQSSFLWRYDKYTDGLLIITDDLKSTYFVAASLEKETVEEFRKSLENLQIPIWD